MASCRCHVLSFSLKILIVLKQCLQIVRSFLSLKKVNYNLPKLMYTEITPGLSFGVDLLKHDKLL
jgi:hypothetical protein